MQSSIPRHGNSLSWKSNLIWKFKIYAFFEILQKPVYFIDAWILNNNMNIDYNLRRTEDFFILVIRNTSILRKPLYFFASTWNSLDPAAERKIFINKLKAHFSLTLIILILPIPLFNSYFVFLLTLLILNDIYSGSSGSSSSNSKSLLPWGS